MSVLNVRLKLKNPHVGQTEILSSSHRFKVVPCGRRFGKTELISAVKMPLISPVLEGLPVGIFTPEFKDFEQTWQDIVVRYSRLIHKKDETKKIIHFKTGGRLDVWTLTNVRKQDSARGRKYARVIYDETQKIDDDVLRHNWTQAVRATLTDYKGDAVFLGTTNGQTGFFYELAQRGVAQAGIVADDLPPSDKSFESWFTYRAETTKNPFIDPDEVEAARDELDELTFLQEYKAVFVNYAGEVWVYSVKDKAVQDKIFKHNLGGVRFNEPIYISFDFNKRPMSAVIMQRRPLAAHKINNRLGITHGLYFLHEFTSGRSKTKHDGKHDGEGSIYTMSREIREFVLAETGVKIGRWYDGRQDDGTPRLVGVHKCPFKIFVTGDASGNTSDGRQSVPRTYYDIIADELQINARAFFKIPSKNPFHAESFVLVNTLIQRNPEFFIDVDACPKLKKDILTVKSDGSRGIEKAKAKANETHLLDCFRYALHIFGK